ncbi:MAG: sugar ABC transporter substrate-binding protein [Actinobacteria bacterium]|nr:sugar ABC transporter substrate-binding protein [Actinomycetota bacterium]
MTSKPLALLAALVASVAVLAIAVGAAFAGSTAPPPAGEPTIPGVEYASGLGAPYLPTTGADRKLSGFSMGPLGGKLQADATKAGAAAGKAAGKVQFKRLTVGYLDIIGGIQSADRAHNALRIAFRNIGVIDPNWVYCDGAGDPAKWNTCGQSLIAQGIDLLTLTGIDPSSIPSVVQGAKAKNIPIINFGGTVGPGYAASLAPNEKLKGQILAKYLAAKLGSAGGKILLIDYPAPWAQDRSTQLTALVGSTPALKIVSKKTTNPADLVAGTQKDVSDVLTANPDIKAVWVDFDVAGAVAGGAIAQKFAGKKFPDRPLLVTFHADPSTQDLIKSGAIDVVVENNWDATAWEVADAAAQFFFAKKPWPKYSVSVNYPGLGDPLTYQIVTSKNLPKQARKYVAPAKDAVSYFIAKWRAQGITQ